MDVTDQTQRVAETAQAVAERPTTGTAPQQPTALTLGRSSVDELLLRIHSRQWWTNLWLAVLAVPLALTLTMVFLAMFVPWVVTLSDEYLNGAREAATPAPPAAGDGPLPTFVAPELQLTPTPYAPYAEPAKAAPAASTSAELTPLFSPEPASKSGSGK